MDHRTVNDIKTEIKKTVRENYCGQTIVKNKEPEMGELEEIIELVAFLFEEYRAEFDYIIEGCTPRNLTERENNTERILIISWTSLEILNDMRNMGNRNWNDYKN